MGRPIKPNKGGGRAKGKPSHKGDRTKGKGPLVGPITGEPGLLSNFEVLELLKKRGASKGPLGGSISASEYKVYEYLVETPAATQTRDVLQTFLKEVKAFKLTEAERLQTVNLRPATAVEAHLIVEDCDERLSSDQVDVLIETVGRILPTPPEKPQEEGAVEGEEGEEEDVEEGEPEES